MNQFAIEYKKSTTAPADPMSGLASIGKTNRFRILGW
jgi:hypothetical protein